MFLIAWEVPGLTVSTLPSTFTYTVSAAEFLIVILLSRAELQLRNNKEGNTSSNNSLLFIAVSFSTKLKHLHLNNNQI